MTGDLLLGMFGLTVLSIFILILAGYLIAATVISYKKSAVKLKIAEQYALQGNIQEATNIVQSMEEVGSTIQQETDFLDMEWDL